MAVQHPLPSTVMPPFQYCFSPSEVPYETLDQNSTTSNRHFKTIAIRLTGVIQLTCAVLSTTFGLIALLVASCTINRDPFLCTLSGSERYDVFAVSAWPLWGAICFYSMAGVVGLASARRAGVERTRKNINCLIVAYLVMSVIAAVCAAGQVIYESFAAERIQCTPLDDYNDVGFNNGYSSSDTTLNRLQLPVLSTYYYEDCSGVNISRAMHVGAAFVAFVEMIVAIVSAVYCCHGIYRRMSSQVAVVQYINRPTFEQAPPPPYMP